jgi:lysophospholipase L1-like esterase
MKKWIKNISSLLFGLLIAFIILEVFLQVYNPFPFRVKGEKIILPANKVYEFHSSGIEGIDSVVSHKKNSMGLRGPEQPTDFKAYTSIIFVGGSTTECTAISDGKEWTSIAFDILSSKMDSVWCNNAGLDGHSTYGHQILLNDHLVNIKPNYIVFLIGANDVGRNDLDTFERFHLKDNYTSLKHKIYQSSEALSLFVNLYRNYKSYKKNLGHHDIPFDQYDTLSYDSARMVKLLSEHESTVINYGLRVKSLIKTCEENNIEPIFLTQPTVMGGGFDSFAGVDLNNLKYLDINSAEYSNVLNSYNSKMIEICKSAGVKFIDLNRALPQNTKYYYDEVHFTNLGCQKVGEIVANELASYLSKTDNLQ